MNDRPSLFQFSQGRHRDVRLIAGIDLAQPFLTNHAAIGLDEVGPAAADYPLVFLKDAESGRLRLTALFGLTPGLNTYVFNDMWQAVYLPLAISAAPFCLAGPQHTLCIDERSPRVTTDTGDALFHDDGSETATLERIRSTLGQLAEGQKAADGLVDTLLTLDLLRPLTVAAQFVTGAEQEIQGLYSINPQLLRQLESAALLDLHAHDHLPAVYTIIQSLNQFNRIRQLHNLGSGPEITAFRFVMGST